MGYIGIDENGKRYDVTKPDFTNMSALTEGENWIGRLRCSFVEIIETNS